MPADSEGVEIRSDAAYNLATVKKLGLGAGALRTARRRGLIVRRIGRRSFVMGRDLLEYLDKHAAVVPG